MADPMNILVLFNDDHGQWALPAYGNRELITPNINYLTRAGVVFENAFTPIPVCSPARACFFTGLMPSQHGVHDYIAAADKYHQREWLDSHQTLPKLLSGARYTCGFSGKWHLGRDEIVQPGFEDWFALSGDYPIQHKGSYRYSDNGRITTLSGYKTHHIADRTIEFLRQHSSDRPFFHFTSFYATHSPWEGQPERLVQKYRDCTFDDIPSEDRIFGGNILNIESGGVSPTEQREARAQYYASISAIDEAVGRILDELETNGLLENTLIIYTSDHGLCLGHHGVWGKGNATAPQNMIEESIRIPMILSATYALPRGERRTEFADHLDLFQTVLEAAKTTPSGTQYAGKSLFGLFDNRAVEWRHTQFGEYGTARMIRTEAHKLIKRYDNQPDELFDLMSDDGECRNILTDQSSNKITADLTARLEAHFTALGCAPPDVEAFNGENRFNTAEAWR
ncbi:sulfatase [uncultured Ruegeria sp.]|uniref:sulfatase family protein n=1 Tax=uncultured Ruegeria sp. TaxID=259304 RepID=UPI00262B87E7|nr:sulfatase-like hydrolase/transferase [uncultured Ruegeria sp.]